MNARTETLPLADLNRFRHGMNAEEGTQLKTDVFPQVYRRRKETNRRRGSGRKTKTRTFHIESRSKNAVPRKSILKSTDERKSDGEERTGKFASTDFHWANAGYPSLTCEMFLRQSASPRTTRMQKLVACMCVERRLNTVQVLEGAQQPEITDSTGPSSITHFNTWMRT
mmetsp:Transcript_1026/g.6509  ORF Transcript_1026/g.6509 Transcript_1026/m.6509 type:complete len:169 (+) Transcript_1026:182-688(+)